MNIDRDVPTRIPNKSDTESQKYVENDSEEMFLPSIARPQIINVIDIKEINLIILDSLCLSSPIIIIEIDNTEDKQQIIKTKDGKKINQKRFTSPPSYIGVKSPHCIKQNHTVLKVIQNNPNFLSLVGNFPTGTLPENTNRYIPIIRRIEGPKINPIK